MMFEFRMVSVTNQPYVVAKLMTLFNHRVVIPNYTAYSYMHPG